MQVITISAFINNTDMQETKPQLSTTYTQLGELFNLLEIAAFEEGLDFGEDLTGCYKWFLSPTAVVFLQKRSPNILEELGKNSRLSCRFLPWQGHKGLAFEVNLIL
ncbi:MAG TPA: hypothetical protein VE944_32885 [Nostoc sp.]|uniref:hypothetical protein n=1 Tax=Nostoc sp. TaxID=1180 RepID=UPI002D576B87|nr:hypothetical protein [Nostoc sp.]HYX19065.1 hypothetical protein [Nostoc sp.]